MENLITYDPLKDKFPVSLEKTKEGILKFNLPARFEIINNKFIIDGAHNPNAIDSLMDLINYVEEHGETTTGILNSIGV